MTNHNRAKCATGKKKKSLYFSSLYVYTETHLFRVLTANLISSLKAVEFMLISTWNAVLWKATVTVKTIKSNKNLLNSKF